MKSKDEYYRLLKANDGQLNEIDLGEKLGLDENETRKIIAQLLSEHRIIYEQDRACSYSIMKTSKTKYRGK